MKKTNKTTAIFSALALMFALGANAQITSYPHVTDCETTPDWVNITTGDNGDWSLATSTPSSGTGPQSGDHSSGSGYFMYTETTPASTQNGQIWLNALYDMSSLSTASIDFWYYMYSSMAGAYGPGKLQLDVHDGTSWTMDVWNDAITNTAAWQNANIDLSAYAGLPSVTLSWTNYTEAWQSDISLDDIVVDGASGGCVATLPQTEIFSGGALPSGWSSSYTSGDGWRFTGTPGYEAASNGRTAGTYAWIDFSGTDAGVILQSPEWCTGGAATADLTFSFFSYHSQANPVPDNILYVEVYDGASWIIAGSIQQNVSGWQTSSTYTLPGYQDGLGQTAIKFRFRGESGGGSQDFYNDILIDDIDVDVAGCANPPTASAGLNVSTCEGSTIKLKGARGGSANSSTWTSSGTGVFNDITIVGPTYTPSAGDITAGSVTLTITTDDPDGAGPCTAATDDMILTIDPAATANAGLNVTICAGSTIKLKGARGGSATSSNWTTAGTGTFDDITIVAATYTPSAADISAGSVVLTITTDDPVGVCTAATDDMTLTIDPAATVTAGVDATICEGSTHTLSGVLGGAASSIAWTTDGDGSFNNATLPLAIYTPGSSDISDGSVILTITSDDPAGSCGAVSDPMTLTINDAATVSAGVNATICEGSTHTLSGSFGGGASSIGWMTFGNGTFDNTALPAATYTPGAADISTGWVYLGITTDDPPGPCGSASNSMLLTIDPAITMSDAGADQNLCNITTATLAGNSVSGLETGVWSVVSGTASATSVNSPTSGVTGLTI
ncbi:MAG TPA: hypothetical protein EYN51_07105, partial [Flavobacteriales bacterium]|nr:hypothetical protein [Flavobacteriales bacterium]